MHFFSCTTNNHRRRHRHRIFTHSELATATSNFSSSSLLGRGSQSSVFLAIFPSSPPLIAAAKLSSSFSELSILFSLPYSPFIVNLLGFTHPSPSIPLLELMPSGSLDHLLHNSSPPPPWRRRLHLAFFSSLSLSFLHSLSPPIIHRDVKPSNILLDSSLQPSSLRLRFGVVLLELITGRRAIDVDHSPPALSDWALSMVTQRRFDEMCDARMGPVVIEEFAAVACLASRCVSSSPEDRPEMAEVAACLRRVRSSPVKRWRKWMTWWGPV
ncbi:serine/threonine-protein kinase-like protein At3g51990 [Dioscorea cayenensis subsp. rotundata]|uniref:Serine/threonine-protein kinase-like protein At3g51990 n=1 Tax=Dioscorea cayennensis subsp. rotundata TaxID=55577 RepID=A0AB40BJZ6_DIOCR|nr:serine/threonine-protein kinase-like protein At3g51990 [Dioscorea cayenensis subsp. rotundata]